MLWTIFLNEFYNFSHTDIEISVWKKKKWKNDENVNFCSLEIASIGFVKISKLKANRQGMVWGKEFKVVLSEKVFV